MASGHGFSYAAGQIYSNRYHSAEGRSVATSDATGMTFPACSFGILSHSAGLLSGASARCASARAFGRAEGILCRMIAARLKSCPDAHVAKDGPNSCSGRPASTTMPGGG